MGDNDLPRCDWCLEKIAWGSYTQARAAPVAQLVVRLIRNEEVGGSSPSWGTILQFRPSRPNDLRTGLSFEELLCDDAQSGWQNPDGELCACRNAGVFLYLIRV